jgi:hypothetical protein
VNIEEKKLGTSFKTTHFLFVAMCFCSVGRNPLAECLTEACVTACFCFFCLSCLVIVGQLERAEILIVLLFFLCYGLFCALCVPRICGDRSEDRPTWHSWCFWAVMVVVPLTLALNSVSEEVEVLALFMCCDFALFFACAGACVFPRSREHPLGSPEGKPTWRFWALMVFLPLTLAFGLWCMIREGGDACPAYPSNLMDEILSWRDFFSPSPPKEMLYGCSNLKSWCWVITSNYKSWCWASSSLFGAAIRQCSTKVDCSPDSACAGGAHDEGFEVQELQRWLESERLSARNAHDEEMRLYNAAALAASRCMANVRNTRVRPWPAFPLAMLRAVLRFFFPDSIVLERRDL